jgi:hypothetical protein
MSGLPTFIQDVIKAIGRSGTEFETPETLPIDTPEERQVRRIRFLRNAAPLFLVMTLLAAVVLTRPYVGIKPPVQVASVELEKANRKITELNTRVEDYGVKLQTAQQQIETFRVADTVAQKRIKELNDGYDQVLLMATAQADRDAVRGQEALTQIAEAAREKLRTKGADISTAIFVIGTIGSTAKSATDELAKTAGKDNDRETRKRALWALANVADAAVAMDTLNAAKNDKDREVAATATNLIQALKSGDKGAVGALKPKFSPNSGLIQAYEP